jgi:hypothetical protein
MLILAMNGWLMIRLMPLLAPRSDSAALGALDATLTGGDDMGAAAPRPVGTYNHGADQGWTY